MIKFCSKIAITGSAAAVALLLSHPVAAQGEDIVEAAAPKGAVEGPGAVEEEANQVALDLDSWHSLQCMVMLYLTIDDASKLPQKSTEGLYLNIGYHLGQFTARSPDISPADLIESVIAQTFSDDDAFKETAAMCEAAAGSIAEQTGAIADRLNQTPEDQESSEDGAEPR